MDGRYSVSFSEIKANSSDASLAKMYIYTSKNKDESIPITLLEETFGKNSLIGNPSTNGLYTVPGFVDTGFLQKEEQRFLISTERFLDMYLDDAHINTMDANPNYFFKGRRIKIKLFVKKHLIKSLVPSRFNCSSPKHETIDDILYKEFEKMRLTEIKEILRTNGITHSANKHVLIHKMIKLLKSSL